MNKITTLAAIAMVAGIMGVGAIAPSAFAVAPNSGVVEPVCHFDRDVNDDGDLTTDDRAWEVLEPNTKGAQNGHIKHGDNVIGEVTDLENGIISEADCLAQPDPDL